MSELLLGLITIPIASLITATFYKTQKQKGSKAHRLIQEATKQGCVVPGVAIKTSTRHGDRDADSSYYRYDLVTVKYEYEVEGKKYYKKMRFQSPGAFTTSYPQNVQIYYDATNPKKAACKEEASPMEQRRNLIYRAIVLWLLSMLILVQTLGRVFGLI